MYPEEMNSVHWRNIMTCLFLQHGYNNPDMEPADEWIKKTVHRYCGIVFTHTKEWGAVSCSNRGEQGWPSLTTMLREFSQETK